MKIHEILNSNITLNISYGIASKLLLSSIDKTFLFSLDLRSYLSNQNISIQCQALRFLIEKGCYIENQDDLIYNSELNLAKTIFLTTKDKILQKICLEIPWNVEQLEELSLILYEKPYELGLFLIKNI